jgi:Na+/melibiose symporter-like transporter
MWTYIKKWFGRKALYPILFALLLAINSHFGNFLTESQITDLATVIISFILGEAAIDGLRIYTEKKK